MNSVISFKLVSQFIICIIMEEKEKNLYPFICCLLEFLSVYNCVCMHT